MGIDARIYFPPQVAVDYVAEAIAIAGGAKWEDRDIGGARNELVVVNVPSLEVMSSRVVTLVDIRFFDEIRQVPRYVNYHFEFGTKGERGLMPRSRAYWLAVGKKVVDAFGGKLDYSDCDNSDIDYEVEVRWPDEWQDGPGYEQLQAILRSITPVTAEDIAAMAEFAAYPDLT